jgi:hypothetical protein
MKYNWFREWGWIYLPTSWQGWTGVLLTVGFCVQVFSAVDRHSHSASDTLYGIFPYVVPAVGILGWLASKTSGRTS